jgi:hypothetical protein
MNPDERAEMQGRCLDVVDQAMEEAYTRLLGVGRPKVAFEDLIHCEGLEPQFEYRLQVPYKLHQAFPELRLPKSFWFYTLKGLVKQVLTLGATIGGDLMVIEAETREGADKLAAKGLAETLAAGRELKYNALLMPEGVVEDPSAGLEAVATGRRAQGGEPMKGEMREKLERMMPDVIKQSAGRYARRRFRRSRLH